MTDRDLTGQNVILIRNEEDPDNFANWGESGFYVDPLGTYITGTGQVLTLDNSSTPADNTPDSPTFEIVKNKSSFNYPDDADDKEGGDIAGDEIFHDPGKVKLDVSMDMYEQRGTMRYGIRRNYHPTQMRYKKTYDYTRYGALIVSHPKDASGNPIPVTPEILKSTIKAAEMVMYFRDVIFKSKGPTHEQGEKVKSSLAGHARAKDVYTNYTFDAELEASAAISGSTAFSLTTQPKVPTRIALDVTVETTPGDLVIVGTNPRGEAITETITTSGVAVYYTKKVFATVDVNGLTPDGTIVVTAAINAAELY